jgi:hypothetical protein
LADWLLLYTWFGLSLPEGLGDSLRHCRRSDLGRSGPPEARAANKPYLVDPADLPIFQTMVSTCRTGAAIDRRARGTNARPPQSVLRK